MFAKRNSLTLAGIWLLLLSVGVFWYLKDARKLVAALDQGKKVRAELSKSQTEIKRLTEVENVHAELRQNWMQSPKRIISADEPSFTLSYINWIMSSNNLNIYYDFVLNGRSEHKDHNRFTYTLTGEGSYNDINQLIWRLTYEPILYKITGLTLTRSDLNSDYLKFNLRLEGFSVDSQSDLQDDLADLRSNMADGIARQHDIFRPLVSEPKVAAKPVVQPKPQLPEKLPGQIDVEKASLKAVTASSIFISEGNSGLQELRVGDSVYLGRLVRINQQANEAEFVITKFGKSERVTLRIDERN